MKLINKKPKLGTCDDKAGRVNTATNKVTCLLAAAQSIDLKS